MKLKDKSLIKYFETKNVNEEVINKYHNKLVLDFNHNSYDMNEVLELLTTFPSLQNVDILSTSSKQIEDTINSLPNSVSIGLLSLDTKTYYDLPESIGPRISRLSFLKFDKYAETINLGDFKKIFPNLDRFFFEFRIDEKNISNLSDITFLASKNDIVNVKEDILKEYREYLEEKIRTSPNSNLEKIYSNLVFGKSAIYNKEKIEEINDDKTEFIPLCEFENGDDISERFKNYHDKSISFYVTDMNSTPENLIYKIQEEQARLQNQSVKFNIYIRSYDNGFQQNEIYNIDEYCEIYKKMKELIGDIDEKLPEEEKFKKIYERVASNIEYDYEAAYPKGKIQKKYAEDNTRACRNLSNGLLQGKAVCAGYADILKNACLMKGIECEYVQGPVDSLKNKYSYLFSPKDKKEELVHSDNRDVILRGYHSWNKVKIKENWYNCDPTWDRSDILNKRTPKYALLSDKTYRNLGRPNVRVFRHECKSDMKISDKEKIFNDLGPCETLITSTKVMNFEETTDEYGNCYEVPAIPKLFSWNQIFDSLKKFTQNTKKKIEPIIYNIHRKINPNFDRTEDVPVIKDDDTEPAPVVKDTEKTEPVSVIEQVDKKDSLSTTKQSENKETGLSWKLSEEDLEKVRNVEYKNLSSQKNLKDSRKNDKEIGE